MPHAIIDRLSPTDLDTISHLYNNIFRPARGDEWFERRFEGRHKILVQVASLEGHAVGFYIGMELKPDTHITWLCGVDASVRRSGIGTQLMEAASDWARTEGYQYFRFECDNRVKPFLMFGIRNDFDIVGLRWDPVLVTNLVIFQKLVGEEHA